MHESEGHQKVNLLAHPDISIEDCPASNIITYDLQQIESHVNRQEDQDIFVSLSTLLWLSAAPILQEKWDSCFGNCDNS